ncbi:MAG: cytochrome b [Pseudomonadales bacterium]
MPLKNTESHYGSLTKVFHWLMFFLLLGAIIAGNLDAAMPDGAEKDEALLMHKGFGILILILGLSRLLWRVLNTTPKHDASLSSTQQKLASSVHWLLYVLMLAQPVTGILMSQSAGYPASFFGLFDVPTLVEKSKDAAGVFHEMHEVIWVLLALFSIGHIGASLHHHFVKKNGVMRRMLRG